MILWKRHCHLASYNEMLVSPSIPSKVVFICAMLGWYLTSLWSHCDVEAYFLPNMIKLQNIWSGCNGEFLWWLSTKHVNTNAPTNVGDCPLNSPSAIEPVDLYGGIVEINMFRQWLWAVICDMKVLSHSKATSVKKVVHVGGIINKSRICCSYGAEVASTHCKRCCGIASFISQWIARVVCCPGCSTRKEFRPGK